MKVVCIALVWWHQWSFWAHGISLWVSQPCRSLWVKHSRIVLRIRLNIYDASVRLVMAHTYRQQNPVSLLQWPTTLHEHVDDSIWTSLLLECLYRVWILIAIVREPFDCWIVSIVGSFPTSFISFCLSYHQSYSPPVIDHKQLSMRLNCNEKVNLANSEVQWFCKSNLLSIMHSRLLF